MTNNKFKQDIIERLNISEEYIYKVFLYLKAIEENKSNNSDLQEAIWNLCEAGELISNSIIEIECSDQ